MSESVRKRLRASKNVRESCDFIRDVLMNLHSRNRARTPLDLKQTLKTLSVFLPFFDFGDSVLNSNLGKIDTLLMFRWGSEKLIFHMGRIFKILDLFF